MKDAASGILVAGIEGTQITQGELAFFESEQIAGVTIFRRNVTPRLEDLRTLVRAFRSTCQNPSEPNIVAIDQEGGRVARLRSPFPDLGPAQKIAEGKDDPAALDFISSYGFAVGAVLRSLGIDTDFAPVCDVLTNEATMAIGDRVWGIDPGIAANRAGSFLEGLSRAGVKGSLKHFPGQGDAAVDTHAGSATVDRPLDELQARELVPFIKLLSKAPMVMMAHVIYPQVCPFRASRSSIWIEDLLRSRWQYQGLVVSDDMDMGAVSQGEKQWQEELVASVAAGIDMLLVCRHLERFKIALEGLRREMGKSKAFTNRVEVAALRVRAMRKTQFQEIN